MDTRTFEAVLSRGQEYMLARFANLPIPGKGKLAYLQRPYADQVDARRQLRAFITEFGPLDSRVSDENVMYFWILAFRNAWYWRGAQRDPKNRRPISAALRLKGVAPRKEFNTMSDPSAFATAVLAQRHQELECDFESGRITVIPASLFAWLVLSLIELRRNLALCARKGCRTPYFVKTHSRSLYCSTLCSSEARQAGQRKWEESNRTGLSMYGRRKKS